MMYSRYSWKSKKQQKLSKCVCNISVNMCLTLPLFSPSFWLLEANHTFLPSTIISLSLSLCYWLVSPSIKGKRMEPLEIKGWQSDSQELDDRWTRNVKSVGSGEVSWGSFRHKRWKWFPLSPPAYFATSCLTLLSSSIRKKSFFLLWWQLSVSLCRKEDWRKETHSTRVRQDLHELQRKS